MNIYSVSLFAFSFGMFLTAVATIVKNQNFVARRFFIFTVSAIGWGMPFALWIGQGRSYETVLMLSRISYAFAVFVPITWLHFVLVFIQKREPFKYFYFFNYGYGVLLLVLCFTDLIIAGLHPILSFSHWVSPGPLYALFFIFYFTLVPYAFYELITALLTHNELDKQSLKYLLIAMFFAFLPGTATFLPVFNIPFPQYGIMLMPLYPVFLEVALNKFGLFEFKKVAAAFRREKLAALGTISASINHEVRNPLHVVHGMAHAFIENFSESNASREGAEALKAMRKITQQTERAMDIIKRFSSFAKQNADAEFKPESVSLKEVLKTVNPLVEHELESKNIELKEEIASNLPSIQADPRHLEEILFNLIVNAAQAIASVEKGGEIVIKAYAEKESVVIEVLDNGPGIAAEELDRVFEPFHTSKAEGTGLGLYITKQLVEKNGGKISVSSKVKHLTTFRIMFNQ